MAKGELISLLKKQERMMVTEIMADDMKKDVLELEMKRLDEMVPLINKGLQEAFDLDECIIFIKDQTGIVIPTEELVPSLTLQTGSGKIIGEEVYDPEEIEELRDDPDVYFISDNFPTYPNLSTPGEKQFFVVSQLYGELENEDAIRNSVEKLVVAAPSTEADHYIKDCFDISHSDKILTRIIGFNE